MLPPRPTPCVARQSGSRRTMPRSLRGVRLHLPLIDQFRSGYLDTWWTLHSLQTSLSSPAALSLTPSGVGLVSFHAPNEAKERSSVKSVAHPCVSSQVWPCRWEEKQLCESFLGPLRRFSASNISCLTSDPYHYQRLPLVCGLLRSCGSSHLRWRDLGWREYSSLMMTRRSLRP